MAGEDSFLMINQRQALLIINNKDRFDIPDQITYKLVKKFPAVKNNVEY